METSLARADVLLRQKGIKASFQRVSIFDYLRHSKAHPSVSKIFDDLHPQIPSLSRATVYNTVNLLVEKDLVTPVQVESGEARYDLKDFFHAHFHCVRCQSIVDIPLSEAFVPPNLPEFQINEVQMHFKGLCPRCR